MKNSFLIIFILSLATICSAQEKLYQIEFVNSQNTSLQSKSGSADSIVFIMEVLRTKNKLLSEGYLLANIDTLQLKRDTLRAVINVGTKYTWLSLGTHNIPEEMLSKAGYRKRDFMGREFSGKAFNDLISKILDNAANSGYPFANLQLEDIEIEAQKVKGVLN